MSVHTPNDHGLSFRRAALIAGLGLLLMTLCAPPAFFHFLPQGFVKGDAAATLQVLRGDGGSPYLIGAFLLFVTYCLDILVLWGLYWVFRTEQPAGAQFVAWTRLVYTVMAFTGLMFHFQAYDLAVSNTIDEIALGHEVLSKIVSADSMTQLALFFFGFHLVALGFVSWTSTRIPFWVAIVVGLAGISYIAQFLLRYLAPDASIGWLLLLALGELIFMLWLFYAAWRAEKNA